MKHHHILWMSIASLAAITGSSYGQTSSAEGLQVMQTTPAEDQSTQRIEAIRSNSAAPAQATAYRRLTLFDMPLKGEDLKAGERYYRDKAIHTQSTTHDQHWGYDLSAKRWDGPNNRWTSVTTDQATYDANPTNEKWVTYGKKVYASADGKIIKCWRNAPENPRPRISGDSDATEPWLHQSLKDGFMPGGGNFISYELADKTVILQAHFIPGSIPASLCPNNNALFSSKKNSSEELVANGKTIKAGQFIGRIGNAGGSKNPHLHIHRYDAGKPKQLRFKNGLTAPYTGAASDIDNWTRFAGKRIPPGPTLIWPARTVGGEYTRFGFPEKDFQRMFDHLADSGYWPQSLDGYSVGGKVFYNFTWTKAPGQWRGFFGQTQSSFNTALNKAKADGYSPVLIESYTRNGQVRYAAVYQKGKSGTWRVKSNRTTAQHDTILAKAKTDGLKPTNISVISVGGARRYTALYRSDNIGSWQLKSQIKENDYQQVFNQNKAAGRFPRYLNAYKHAGQTYFVAIFASKPTGSGKARHKMSGNTLQAEFNSAMAAGLQTKGITAFDGASTKHRYAAIWR